MKKFLLLALSIACSRLSAQTFTAGQMVYQCGTAAADLANAQRNPTLDAQITADANIAASAVQGWKVGTDSKDAIASVRVLEHDIASGWPLGNRYRDLMDLDHATLESLLVPMWKYSSVKDTEGIQPKVTVIPTTKAEFVAQWNAMALAQNLSKATIDQ